MPAEPFRPWLMKVGVLTAAVQELTRQATWVEPDTLTPPVCPDSDDDWVLATALAGGAEAIVTGDRDLLDLDSFEGIAILTPRQFLELADG